jgi:hypothetical protein
MNNETQVKKDTPPGRKKALIIAVCSVLSVLAAAAALFLARDSITLLLAQKKIESSDYSAALGYLKNNGSESAQTLAGYAQLRLEINADFGTLLSDFDIGEVRSWRDEASRLKSEPDSLSEEVSRDISALYDKLDSVCSLYDEYTELEDDIYDLMDVFNEVNRLYTKDYTGQNRTFTISGERTRIMLWEQELIKAENFLYKLPSESSAFLYTNFVREARAETSELSESMDRLLESSGVSENDEVRVSGDGQKVFPSVESTAGVRVNLTEKDSYCEYMFSGVCRTLAEHLAEFYTNR